MASLFPLLTILLIGMAATLINLVHPLDANSNGGDICPLIKNALSGKIGSSGVSTSKASSSQSASLGKLVKLVSQRLDLARPVALYKRQKGQAIDDPVREKAVLDSVLARANGTLSAQFARTFFEDQMNANKIVQYAYVAQWNKTGAPKETAPDLAKETRPKIDQLTNDLLAVLPSVEAIRSNISCSDQLGAQLSMLVQQRAINISTEADTPKAFCTALAHICANQK